MTVDSLENKGISDFLLQVTQASSFSELAKAFKKLSTDFKTIEKQDSKGRTKTFLTRYKELESIAQEILDKDPNGNIPTEQQLAIFGEMVVLRDVCLRRMKA
ncbi:MAG: hypothetical protein FK734_15845 [Asgard group archaeon]|nr:hypothetical protein [Asgard group archaeon]